jgi:hypothetical protein
VLCPCWLAPAGKGKEGQSVGPTHTEASTMEPSMEDLQTGEDMHKFSS